MALIDHPILPMSELRLATNNFSEENLMKQTPSVVLYKGQLDQSGQSIPIVVRKYTNPDVSLNESGISLCPFHKNVATLFKVASEELADDDDDFDELDDFNPGMKVMSKGYLIYKYEVNESLDKHLSGSTLTWMQRLNICVDVARVLCYIHDGDDDDQSLIHGNIKSSKILLNQNWEPTLHGLRADMMIKKHSVHHPSNYDGTLQYTDPAYEKTKSLSHKSDVYSFGVVLFEVLLGRVASIPISDQDNWSFARFARSHYERETLGDIIDPILRQQMDSKSLKNFSETAYYCLLESRPQRPDMNQVVKKLERALDFQQKHESPEHSTTASVEAPLSDQLKGKNLDHLRISLSDIISATHNFSETCRIGKGGYGTVYKAELSHFDGSHSSTTEGVVRGDLPKRISTVAIKRISKRVDKQGEKGFLAEIEMLSKCKHTNVVSLLGLCDEGDEMILIYEYISNGSLEDYLGDHDKLMNLNWAQRMQICLDIAHGLNYVHSSTKDKGTIIHRDIKSANVLLDDNWVAKIGDFGLSKLNNTDQQSRTLLTQTIAGTEVYLDPEYASTGRLKKESDVYSLGVVLLEIMCGRLAYDNIYYVNNEKGLASVSRRRFKDGTLKYMVDPRVMEADDNIFMLNGGLNQDSLDTFTKIAYRCVAETQVMRPTMQDVINELQKAIHFQKRDNLHVSLKDIQVATQNFSEDKCIEEGRYWKQYEGQIPLVNANEHSTVIVKRFDNKSDEGRKRFLTEVKVLVEFKHKNIVALAGYCTEKNERIICYEHALNGRLNKHVQDASLTWMQRIKICIDMASGLSFLHKEDDRDGMIHSDIKSGSILLDAEWNAKISNLELASTDWKVEKWKHDGDDYGSLGFMDPTRKVYVEKESDWYSFSMILLEMFCGRSAKNLEPWSFYKDTLLVCASIENFRNRVAFEGIKERWASIEDFINEVAFEGIKEQISANSCKKFFQVALNCGIDKDDWRVIKRLEKALQAQEDHEIWEPKLPTDYQEILDLSKIKEDHEIEKYSKKRLYELLCKGVLIKKGNAWVSLGNNRQMNEMISARKFVFKKGGLRNWRSTPESRFPKVAEMFTISNLKIKINTRTQFLSPGINYGVHLVLKFCGPRKSLSKSAYVNLTYKTGKETLHTYFATWRDKEWMMIELCRFLNHQKDTNFEVQLESFSQYYCERNGIYIEGIEFRAIDDVNNEESVKIEEVQQILESNTDNMVQMQQLATDSEEISKRSANDDEGEKGLSNEKEHLMLLAKDVLYDSSKVKCVKLFRLKPSEEPRFQEVIELLPRQVFSLKCKIQSQMLLPDTNYTCYLVFKLSEKCHGLHCPVKVRDVLHWKNKEIRILYFRTPDPWNIHDNHRVPKQRDDGWMEVVVWEFNSTSELLRDWDDGLIKLFEELRNGYIPMHLKLIAYEGTMSGLTVGSLEIRPM